MRIAALLLFLSCAVVQTAACQTRRLSSGTAAAATPPPAEKDVIYMVMQNWDVALKTDPSCAGVGTDASDSTIGQYLSGFWQYQTDSTGGPNRLTVRVEPGTDRSVATPYWKAVFIISGRTEGEPWSWGVSFGIRMADRSVMRNSFRCIGGG